MLESKDRKKLELYVDKIIKGIATDAKSNTKRGMADKQVINKVINVTVNKFTPESKMILSSTYNMMMERTLDGSLYESSQNKAEFYEIDILKELNNKFDFDIPKNIDYEETKNEINRWVKAGTVVIIGGVISIPLKSWIPVGIAVVIAGIMVFLLKEGTSKTNMSVDALIDEYLDSVKKTMMIWIDTIEKYYDDRVSEIERKMVG